MANKKTDPIDAYPYLVYSSEPDAVQEDTGGGVGGTHRFYYFGEDPNSVYYEPGNVPVTLEDTIHG